ncbi:MAG: hypothetical protein GY796_14860 [Chloroflexi bacterium]|nr:hypothetical protein [Chloroflexota bacterium]
MKADYQRPQGHPNYNTEKSAMKETSDSDIQELKQQEGRNRKLLFGLICGAAVLVLLCGIVNFTFFATGMIFGNVWPFSSQTNTASPNMIAASQVDQPAQPAPIVYDARLYKQSFDGRNPSGWQTFTDGWDVQNGVYYGTNTRSAVPTDAIYGSGFSWNNYAVEADVTAMSAKTESNVQLLFRYQGQNETGRCTLLTDKNGQRQLKLVTPEGEKLTQTFHYVTEETYRLRATANYHTLTCEIIGYPDTRLTTTTNVLNGTVGFKNRHVSGAFDNLEVVLLD